MSLVANSRYKLDHGPPPLMRKPSGLGRLQPDVGRGVDPVTWAETNAQIVHPARGRIPFAPYAYQRAFLESYGDTRRIVLKARQIGFSQVFALEGLYAAVHEPESTVLLVSRSQDLAVNLLRYCYQSYNNLREAPTLTKQNESEMGFANGSRIKSIPANRSTGRGFAATRGYLDEVAYAAYAVDIYQCGSPSVSHGGALTIGSTPNGMGNLFHTLCIAGEGFTRFVVPWWECPAYWTPQERARGVPKEDAAWYRRERPKYTAQSWAAEFECDFIGSGVVVFSITDIDRAADGAVGDVVPMQGHQYVTAVDIGRRQDATVINTFDATRLPYQRVAHERVERTPYPVIQQMIEDRAQAYPGTLIIESNGVGDPVIENLSVPCVPFVTSVRSKVQAIQSLQLLLEQGDIKAAWTDQERRELIGYQWDDRALVQDCVMSLAIAATVLDQSTITIHKPAPLTNRWKAL